MSERREWHSKMFKAFRLDTWVNAMTGLGNALRDKLQGTEFQTAARLDDQTLENLYHEEDIASRICDARPGEALRQGVKLAVEGDEKNAASDFLDAEWERLGIMPKLEDALVWANVFGGAALYLGIVDEGRERDPVNWDKIQEIRFVNVLDKRDLQPSRYYGNPLDTKYQEPELYRINLPVLGPVAPNTPVSSAGSEIHESRLIIFDGARTSQRRKQQNGGWSDSLLQKVHEVLVQFNVGWQGTAHLLQDASQGIFKLQGLIDMIAEGNEELLHRRMETVDMSRSIARAIMVDAENEDFRREQYNFTGLPDVLEKFMLRMAAAADMPVTVLMGQSPSGLNATGESDMRLWYDSIRKYQSRQLTPKLRQLCKFFLAQRSYTGPDPKKLQVIFPPPWQETRKEQAETNKTIAETDKIYIDAGVILPEEVALTRGAPGGFNKELELDMDSRKDMLKAELQLARDTAGEPEPDPMMQGQGNGTPAPKNNS